MASHVTGLCACQLVVEAASPPKEGKDPARNHGHSFDFGTVAMAIEVLEFIAYSGKNTAFPWANLFGESGGNECD